MLPVNSFRLCNFIQSEAINDHICSFCQFYRFPQFFFIGAAVPLITSGYSNYLQRILTDQSCHRVHLRRIYHRRACPLIPRGNCEISYQRHLCPSLQRKDMFLIFQENRAFQCSLFGEPVMFCEVNRLLFSFFFSSKSQYRIQQFVHTCIQLFFCQFLLLYRPDEFPCGIQTRRRHFQVGAGPDTLHMTVAASPVCYNKTVEFPLIPQDFF